MKPNVAASIFLLWSLNIHMLGVEKLLLHLPEGEDGEGEGEN